MADNLYQQSVKRWAALKSERASWVAHWSEISDNLLPRSGRFLSSQRNRGEKRHNNIYDNTAVRAVRTAASGMMYGMTNRSKPWFRMTTADSDLAKYQSVKIWLDEVTKKMYQVFERSNTYESLHALYEELFIYGTAVSIVVPDFNNLLHHHILTAGEYCISTDARRNVDTLYREYDMTVRQLVQEFGIKAVSQSVRNSYERGDLDRWVTVIHGIEPRSDRDPKAIGARAMAWRSVHFEVSGAQDKVLRESGFEMFPALCPRWSTFGGDIYGTSPGMECLGDVKQLQHQQKRKAQGIDAKAWPPLQVPSAMKGRDFAMLPGGITYVDMAGPAHEIKPLLDGRYLDLQHLLIDIQDVRQRINSAFYSDIFLMLSNAENTRMTATEVAERHEEKLLMLGPVFERLQNELLSPLIDIAFSAVVQNGIAPMPPQELQGQELKVEMISLIAQAQRAIGVNSIDRFMASVGAVAAVRPDVLDKIDVDEWADSYGEALGVDPRIIVPADKVAELRAARAAQAAQTQQMEMAAQGAAAARDLSAAKLDQPSALTAIAQKMGAAA